MLNNKELEQLKELQANLDFIEETSYMTITAAQSIMLNILYESYKSVREKMGSISASSIDIMSLE